jgi:anti-anti-sigma factor
MPTTTYEDINDDFRLIVLDGRLDVHGTEMIEKQFAEQVLAGKKRIVVNLANVTFLSSFGIRLLIGNAKALKAKEGRLVLVLGTNDFAAKTLKQVCADAIMPMFMTLDQAESFLAT